jgi:hypothetical protein
VVDFENLEKKDVLENGILKGSPARKAKLSHWHLSEFARCFNGAFIVNPLMF